MHDAVIGAEAGLPSAVVVTTEFVHLSELTRRNAGEPDALIHAIEHPLFTRDAAWIEETADQTAAALIERWSGTEARSTTGAQRSR